MKTPPPLPKKKAAVFHHPLGFELYDSLAMDLHAMTYAEPMLKEIEQLRDCAERVIAAFETLGRTRDTAGLLNARARCESVMLELKHLLTPNGEVRGASVTAQPACEASSGEAATSTVVLDLNTKGQ